MAKKRNRPQNPQLSMEDDAVATKRRSKGPKNHQKRNKLIPSDTSSKILNEALIQQQEIQKESTDEQNSSPLFFAVKEPLMDEVDIDKFPGFDNIPSRYGSIEEETDEEDEKLLEAFLSKNAAPQWMLADHIVDKIKEIEALVSSELRPLLSLDNSAVELYKGVGKLLSKYTAGKVPKAFKFIPFLRNWEDVLYLTMPENWSANAMYQATRIFASNFDATEAGRFYRLVLLPRIREDIRKDKRLQSSLYQSLMKSLYKPGAFYKGILFPLCECAPTDCLMIFYVQSRTCTLREAVIIGSVMRKASIPQRHSSAALIEIAQMEYCGTTSYFIKLLFEKEYSLSSLVLNAAAAHFMRFVDDTRVMPVIWHLSLLAFVQRYKTRLREEDKDNLRVLIEKQNHRLITPEILRELNNIRNQDEEEDDLMSISSPIFVINKTIEEDRFDIPEVPMED